MSSPQKALLLLESGAEFSIGTVPVPTPGPGELLVKIESIALGPFDWKLQAFGPKFNIDYPAIVGVDAAGIVAGLGEGVTGFAVGDKVFAEGRIHNLYGTYQQYFLAPADITAKVPDNLSLDEASTVPSGVVTAAVALFLQGAPNASVGLYPPWEEGGLGKYAGKPIVILGGASSVGQFAIQLARLAGFSPLITTASLHNTELLKSFGATHVLDRKLSSSELVSAVRGITPAPLDAVFDAVSFKDTQSVAYELLAPGGTLVATLPDAVEPSEKTADKKFIQVFGFAHAPANRALSARLFSKVTQFLREGTIKPNPIEVLPNGLAGIPAGLERLKKNQVSGYKLVVHPQETP